MSPMEEIARVKQVVAKLRHVPADRYAVPTDKLMIAQALEDLANVCESLERVLRHEMFHHHGIDIAADTPTVAQRTTPPVE